MRRVAFILLYCLVGIMAWAQQPIDEATVNGAKNVLSGTVCHEKTNEPIRQASVVVEGTNVSVVTNDDGFFTLKTNNPPEYISVSHLGYQKKRIRVGRGQSGDLIIRLKPTAVELKEVVVWTGDPRDLVNIAISKIPDNYINKPELYKGFYRETAMKQQHYIYVAEGVVDMYKSSYQSSG